MFHRLGRHIREGFIGVKRHFGMAISSASSITITLILVGLFVILTGNLAVLSKDIENSISLVALVDYKVTTSSELKEVENNIKAINGVSSIEYRTKDEEFDFYNEAYPEMAEFSEIYRDENPFHDTFIVSVSSGDMIEGVKASLGKINGISSVEDGGANTYVLVDILKSARIAGAALVLALCALAVYLIYNTIKITIATREREIWIERWVGARNGFIRAPFLVEGIIIGILGSILPIALLVGGYIYLFKLTNGVLLGVFTLINPYPFLLYLCLGLLGLGVIVGFIGSYFSVCKYLRLSR